ncbi:hypothetical protein B0H14DRAFT_2614669 [Mycena olivaceomarginata]|nr:hypothetical protein B0H14DRAFT_2614669 [Mycena olivaceomarginata]
MVSTRSATASSPRRPRSSLSASHAILYPVTHTLGVRGTKKDKRRQINQMWRENLEIHSPYPHFSARLSSNHRGHDLTGPILNTNKNAGGYRQVCVGCPQAGCLPANRKGKRGGKTAVFCIRAGLPLHTLQSGMLGRLARARAELQPVSRAAARVYIEWLIPGYYQWMVFLMARPWLETTFERLRQGARDGGREEEVDVAQEVLDLWISQ